MSAKYEFYKENKDDLIYWVDDSRIIGEFFLASIKRKSLIFFQIIHGSYLYSQAPHCDQPSSPTR